jgi:hypothetical protein
MGNLSWLDVNASMKQGDADVGQSVLGLHHAANVHVLAQLAAGGEGLLLAVETVKFFSKDDQHG